MRKNNAEQLKKVLDEAILNASENASKVESVTFLIGVGANVNAKDKRGQIPLHVAALFNKKEVAKILIQEHADVDAKDNYNKTPLHYAVDGWHAAPEFVKLLIDSGAKVNARTNFNDTPLHLAVKSDNGYEIVKLLLNNGANVNIVNGADQTPLQIAQSYQLFNMVKFLRDHGAKE